MVGNLILIPIAPAIPDLIISQLVLATASGLNAAAQYLLKEGD